MIIEHRTTEKHQNADSLSNKKEYYKKQEQWEADKPEAKYGFSFMDKETHDSLPLTIWLDKSGKTILSSHLACVSKHQQKKITYQKNAQITLN